MKTTAMKTTVMKTTMMKTGDEDDGDDINGDRYQWQTSLRKARNPSTPSPSATRQPDAVKFHSHK